MTTRSYRMNPPVEDTEVEQEPEQGPDPDANRGKPKKVGKKDKRNNRRRDR